MSASEPTGGAPSSFHQGRPAPGKLCSEMVRRLYAAETPMEGVRAITSCFPFWLPPATVLSAIGLYCFSVFVRIKYARWRVVEMRRAERNFDLLENLRGMHAVSAHHRGLNAHALAEDDGEEEDEEMEDETVVSVRDVDEFRSSLGVQLPRDEDLLGILEQILNDEPIPDGWVLYRTTAGIIRFMNLNTQELSFFPPSFHKHQQYIESELRRRNREAMESKYATPGGDGTDEDRTFRVHSSARMGYPPHIQTTGSGEALSAERDLSTADAGVGSECRDAGAAGASSGGGDGAGGWGPHGMPESPHALFDPRFSNSVVRRMLHFFLKREQQRIKEKVARDHAARHRSQGTSSNSSSSGSVGNDSNDDAHKEVLGSPRDGQHLYRGARRHGSGGGGHHHRMTASQVPGAASRVVSSSHRLGAGGGGGFHLAPGP